MWLAFLLFILAGGLFAYAGYLQGLERAGALAGQVSRLQQELKAQELELDDIRHNAQDNLDASARHLADLQARLTRLDALGERLTRLAGLDEGEFSFGDRPALGGPVSEQYEAHVDLEVDRLIRRMAEQMEAKQHQLHVLETLLANRRISEDLYVAGQPTRVGWISSPFGVRIDPINGRRVMHRGVDFAAPEASEVIAVASGVVTYAGERGGYGRMVEINHGGGYTTLYGHHKKLAVSTGDVVKKGQTIGYVGSTGRSTGPHVHYEVLKDGRTVDPASYIRRERQ